MTEKTSSLDWVRRLTQTLKDHDLHEIQLETEDVALTLKAKPKRPKVSAPQATAGAEDVQEADVTLLCSNDVGIFRATVDLVTGSSIEKGQKFGVVESVSINHDLTADSSGTLVEVLAFDGDPVEYGQPLLVLSQENRGSLA